MTEAPFYEQRIIAWLRRFEHICCRVHKQLWGHSESVIQRALAFDLSGLPGTSAMCEVTEPVQYLASSGNWVTVGNVRYDIIADVKWCMFAIEVKVVGGGGSRWSQKTVERQISKYQRTFGGPCKRVILASFHESGVRIKLCND